LRCTDADAANVAIILRDSQDSRVVYFERDKLEIRDSDNFSSRDFRLSVTEPLVQAEGEKCSFLTPGSDK